MANKAYGRGNNIAAAAALINLCVCVCARHGKRQKSVARFRQTFVIKATATGTAPDAPRQP